MKIRTSFVSNSSTSSFVFLGYVLDKEDVDIRELAVLVYGGENLDLYTKKEFGSPWKDCNEDEVIEALYEMSYRNEICVEEGNGDNGFEEGKIAVGFCSDVDEGDNCEYSASEIIKDLSYLPSVNKNELKLICGTRMS